MISKTLALFPLLLLAGLQVSQAETECSGIGQLHNFGTDIFATSSRVYRENGSVIYETCVENRGARDLWIDWRVPGPTTYVLPGMAIPAMRPFSTEETISATGCLEYGSFARVIPNEPFQGHEADRQQLALEFEGGCGSRSVGSVSERTNVPPTSVMTKVRLFVPSDRDRPDVTMLEFNADVVAFYGRGLPSAQKLSYSISRVEGREGGTPDAMIIRVSSPDPFAFPWTAVSHEALIKDGATLDFKDSFELFMAPIVQPRLGHVRYEILDEKLRRVGAFQAPVWQEAVP